MLAQVRRDERERGPVLVRARDGNRKTHRDRRRARLALDYLDAHAGLDYGLRVTLRRRGARGELRREVRLKTRDELRREAARETDDEVRLRVVLFVEGAHVVERQLLKRSDRAHVVMAVRVARVDEVVEPLLAK